MTRSILRASAAGVAAAVLALAGSAYAQGIAGDKYLCWQAKLNKKIPYVPAKGLPITVKDQFDAATHNYELKDNSALCAPVLPAANDPNIHYVQYPVKDLKTPQFISPTTIYNVSDMFVSNAQIKKLKPVSIMVRSSKLSSGVQTKCKLVTDPCPGTTTCDVAAGYCVQGGATPTVPAAPAGTTLDNYMCYQPSLVVKPVLPTAVVAADQFGNYGTYELKKMTKLCAPANKDGETPGAETHSIHLTCYQAKGLLKPLKQTAAVNNTNVGNQWVTPQKVIELCGPALKSTTTINTPTTLTTESQTAGGVCGTYTVSSGAGVPNRLDPNNPSVNPNAGCIGASNPETCCTGAAAGHCHIGTTITCGSLNYGGGGPLLLSPHGETAQAAGTKVRYTLACMGPTDTACVVSGNAGDLPAGIQCSLPGCTSTAPVETISPTKVCSTVAIGAAATGTVDLVAGKFALTQHSSSTINIGSTTSFTDTSCPRCRVGGTSTTLPLAAATPTSSGLGVCDSDSNAATVGDACRVYDQALPGLAAECQPNALASAVLNISSTTSTAGTSASSPTGDLCAVVGQGGNADCTGPDAPQDCCTGSGTGGCNNYSGCVGSANVGGAKYADAPGTCTGIAVTGQAVGALLDGTTSGVARHGGLSCVPAVGGGFGPLLNGSIGLPGPAITAYRSTLTLD